VSSSFSAWVPSITGRLSFSQIGEIVRPRADYINYDNQSHDCTVRCVEIRTRRLDDSVFQLRSLQSRILGVNIVFEMDAISKTVGTNKPFLSGVVNCYVGRARRWNLQNDLSGVEPAFQIQFCLSRAGLIKLFKLKLGQKLRETESQEILYKYFVAQSYFFIKDMVHRHRHHGAEDDTFIEIQPSREGWKKMIAFQLSKRIIRRPVNLNLDSYQSAIGILAYLRAYQAAINTEVYSAKHMDAMEKSLKAEHDRLQHQLTARRWIGAGISSIVAFMSIRFVDWDTSSITPTQFFSTVTLITILVLTAHYTYVFNFSARRWFIELQKPLTAIPLRGRGMLIGITLLFLSLSYFLATNPQKLNFL